MLTSVRRDRSCIFLQQDGASQSRAISPDDGCSSSPLGIVMRYLGVLEASAPWQDRLVTRLVARQVGW